MKLYFHFVFLILIFPFHQSVSAQDTATFIIVGNENADIDRYIEALNNADMSNFRLQDKRVRITFTSGVEIELLSAKELAGKGMKIEVAGFLKEFDPRYQLPQFSLAGNGHILALYQSRIKK